MKNVTCTWNLPTTRESGRPLDISDIQHTQVLMKADAAPSFTPIDTVGPTAEQSIFIGDVDIGQWVIRLIVVDTDGRESAPVDTSFEVLDETPPSSVTGVGITLS